MKAKVLVTGSEGMLASDVIDVWSDAGYDVIGLTHSQMDIARHNEVTEAIKSINPVIVFNTPGIGVDVCEQEPTRGFQLHSWGASNVASACERFGAVCIFISSCGLFGDKKKFYSEYDQVELKTNYAKSKSMGEQLTLQKCRKAFVIRPGWLFGGKASHVRNFVFQRYLEAQGKSVLTSASDKFGSPTYTKDLAHMLLTLIETGYYGLYHVTNAGGASRYEYVKCVIDAFGLDTKVEPVDSSFFKRTAPVPDCEMLANQNIEFLGIDPMDYWENAIQRYVNLIKKEIIA